MLFLLLLCWPSCLWQGGMSLLLFCFEALIFILIYLKAYLLSVMWLFNFVQFNCALFNVFIVWIFLFFQNSLKIILCALHHFHFFHSFLKLNIQLISNYFLLKISFSNCVYTLYSHICKDVIDSFPGADIQCNNLNAVGYILGQQHQHVSVCKHDKCYSGLLCTSWTNTTESSWCTCM